VPKDRRWLLIALVVAIPVLILIGSLAQRTWYPTGDQAQAELRMQSLPDDPPLLGAAGRIQDDDNRQGNHPGPLMFWVTWPFYEVLGGSSWAFEAATAFVNVAWLVLAAVAGPAGRQHRRDRVVRRGVAGAHRRLRPRRAVPTVEPVGRAAAVHRARAGHLERDRGRPVGAGDRRCRRVIRPAGPHRLPAAGHAVGSPLALAPIVRWWIARRAARSDADRSHDDRPDDEVADGAPASAGRSASTWLLPLGVAALVGALAWSGPLIDALTNEPSNVDKLLANFGSPDEDPIGLGRGFEAVLQSIDPFGPWVWGGVAVDGSAVPGLVLLLAWSAVGVGVAIRRESAHLTTLNAVLLLCLLLGTLAVSRIFGALYLYTFRWIVVLAGLMVFTLGWGLARLLPRPPEAMLPRLAAAAVIGLVALSTVTTVRIVRQEIPYDQSWRAMQELGPEVARQLDPDTRYLVRWDDPAYLGGLGFGLVLDLERRGFDVGADPQFVTAVEPRRVRCAGDYDAVLTVVTGERRIASYRDRAGLELLAQTDSREDLTAWEGTYAALLDALAAAGEPVTADELEGQLNLRALAPDGDPEVTRLAGVLVLAGMPTAVFLQDPAPEPAPLVQTPLNETCWR
jgi:hypothetical protein